MEGPKGVGVQEASYVPWMESKSPHVAPMVLGRGGLFLLISRGVRIGRGARVHIKCLPGYPGHLAMLRHTSLLDTLEEELKLHLKADEEVPSAFND